MGKVRHRKRVRSARLAAAGAPLGSSTNGDATSATVDPQEAGAQGGKKARKEAEVANLLEKLRSSEVEERIWASAALSGMLLTLPALTLRSLLSKNLIGLLIERLGDGSDSVVVESLGALRNLAVSSPPSILSEMYNKRILLPLSTNHLPLLLQSLPARLAPPPAAIKAPLPATATQRAQAAHDTEQAEGRRRLYWDWAENVLSLLWCLAESTTKVLSGLNADNVAPNLVAFCLCLLDSRALGLTPLKEGKEPKKGKQERVPLFVALSAAQTLHAFVAGNPACFKYLLGHPSLRSLVQILETSEPPKGLTTSDSHGAVEGAEADEWRTIRVLAFGVMLELTKGGKTNSGRDVMRASLKEHAGVLSELVGQDLGAVANACTAAVPQLDPNPAPMAAPSPAAVTLATAERQLSTLQLSLEVLSTWVAANDASGLSSGAADDEEEEGFSDEEDWGGAEEGDVEMGEDEDDEEMIIQKPLPQAEEPVEEDENDMDEDDSEDEEPVVKGSDLPLQLLALATPSSTLSFAEVKTETVSNATPLPSTLLATSTNQPQPAAPARSSALAPELVPISELLTTVHVRALEALFNLFIGYALLPKPHTAIRPSDLQKAFEGAVALVAGALSSAGDGVGAGGQGEEDDVQERRMEVVMAGTGAIWAMCRVGLGEKGKLQQTPAGEAIRVRATGALGWIGRRKGVSNAENEAIGSYLLSILPQGKTASGLAPTHEVLLQVIDSVIDLYSDEDASYDVPVFRQKGFLPRLQASVAGVRASHKRIDRKKFPELRSRADGALANLEAFVQYRSQFA